MIYEANFEAGGMCVRVLFNGIPTIDNLSTALQVVLREHEDYVVDKMKQLLSDAEKEEGRFQSGGVVLLMDDREQVGSLFLQTRTLFRI